MHRPGCGQDRTIATGAGVAERLAELWSYRPRLISTLRRRGASQPDAEDAATEAILRVATCDSFRLREAAPWPYLKTAAVHVLADEQRRAVKEEIVSRDPRWLPRSGCMEDEVANRDAARRELHRVQSAESDLVARMMLRHADGLTWIEVFAEFGISTSARMTNEKAIVLLNQKVSVDEDYE
jgi:DNA-directed RNA polymerase specialized sigma24 family protein